MVEQQQHHEITDPQNISVTTTMVIHKCRYFTGLQWMIALPVLAIGIQNGRSTIIVSSFTLNSRRRVVISSSYRIHSATTAVPHNSRRINTIQHAFRRSVEQKWRTRLYSAAAASSSSNDNNNNNSNNIQSVAIIGGGISGLACAQRLSNTYQVTVYDTGRLRPGGRSSSRWIDDIPETPKQLRSSNANKMVDDSSSDDDDDVTPKYTSQQRSNGLLTKFMYDHAAQVVSRPTHPRYEHFRKQLDEWESQGILRRFAKDTLYNIASYKKFEPINNITFYYGTVSGGGIGGIATSIVQQSGGKFQLQQNIWIPPRNGIEYLINQRKWKVLDSKFGRPSLYDAIIIAHNGKCADQIVRNAPSPAISKLMKVQFQYKVPACGGPCMTLSSIYSLTFAIPTKTSILSKYLPDTFLSGYVKNHPALRFLTCQTRKYGSHDDGIEVWTVLSSGSFAMKYKASQENLPNVIVQKVTRLLLLAIEEALTGTVVTAFVTDRSEDDEDDIETKKALAAKLNTVQPSALELSVLDQHLQLWGAGVPMNVWDAERGRTPAGYLYDSPYRFGVCGDWLVEASIAGAWTSGRLLADHMMSTNHTKSHGFKGSFRRSVATAKFGIGMLQT